MVEERMLQLTEIEQDADDCLLGQKILDLRKRGRSYYECSRALGLTVAGIKRIEEQTRDKVFATISPEIEHDRHLAVGTLNDAIRGLREIAEHSYDYGERIAAWSGVVKAIAAKAKIIGLESTPARVTNNTLNITEDQLMEHIATVRGLNG